MNATPKARKRTKAWGRLGGAHVDRKREIQRSRKIKHKARWCAWEGS